MPTHISCGAAPTKIKTWPEISDGCNCNEPRAWGLAHDTDTDKTRYHNARAYSIEREAVADDISEL